LLLAQEAAISAEYRPMSVSLSNPIWRSLLPLATLAAAAVLCWQGGKHALAAHWAESSRPDNWLRAANLEPTNAERWQKLGRYRQLDFENTDLNLAIAYYRRASSLDPRSPYILMDLAGAYDMDGNPTEAEAMYQAAERAHPISGEVAWRYGNFLLNQGRLDQAFTEIHRALQVQPALVNLAISRCWHSSTDIHLLLDKVLPNTDDADWQALAYLVPAKEADASLAVWAELKGRGSALDLAQAFPLVDLLIEQNRVVDAWGVWQDALKASGTPAGAASDSLVSDGGFETDFTNGGFGWRYTPQPGVIVAIDTSRPHIGVRSVVIDFDGTNNVNFDGLWEYVPVQPNTHYHFSGFIQMDEITSDSGPRFEVQDATQPGGQTWMTENLTGTQPWTPEDMDIQTGPQTHLLTVRVVRPASEHFGGKIDGTAWVDDVSLVATAPGTGDKR
jgi:tetratricopeptide (TPR) repeat protein